VASKCDESVIEYPAWQPERRTAVVGGGSLVGYRSRPANRRSPSRRLPFWSEPRLDPHAVSRSFEVGLYRQRVTCRRPGPFAEPLPCARRANRILVGSSQNGGVMAGKLNGRVAVVTGAASGIGRSSALVLPGRAPEW
jgi:hypothetical protein